jgi:hypothetical protein
MFRQFGGDVRRSEFGAASCETPLCFKKVLRGPLIEGR